MCLLCAWLSLLQMHSAYKKNFAKIEHLVQERGGRIRGRPGARGKRAFVHSIMKRLRLLKKKQSHCCPICTRKARDVKELKRLKARLSSSHSTTSKTELEAEIQQLQGNIAYATHHEKRRDHQRQATIDKRAGLAPGARELLVFIDYVSFYLASGTKQNVLVVEAEAREGNSPDSEVTHSYFDYLSNHSHDGYFTTVALRQFFADVRDKHPDLTSVTFSNDNGMVSAMLLWTLSRLAVESGITVEEINLAPYHAYSLCDSHGGHFKPALRAEACADVEVNLDGIRAVIEATCDRTIVTVLDISEAVEEELDRDWFPSTGPPRTIEAVRTAGHIVMLGKLGTMKWRHLVGQEVDVLGRIGRRLRDTSASRDAPTWLFHDASPTSAEYRRCHMCSLWEMKTVEKAAGHTCLFIRGD